MRVSLQILNLLRITSGIILITSGIFWSGFGLIIVVAAGRLFEDMDGRAIVALAVSCLPGPILIVAGWLILRRVDRADPRGFEPIMPPPAANVLPAADNTAAADEATESRE